MELYEKEEYVYQQIPIKILNHYLEEEDIYSPLHWHQSVEIDLVIEGRIMLKSNGKSYEINEGNWNLVNSGELHLLTRIGRNDIYKGITLLIAKSFLDAWLGKDVYLAYSEDVTGQELICEVIRKFADIKKKSGKFYKAELMENLFLLVRLLGEYCIIESARNRNVKGINSIKGVINYIDGHYKENISLKSVAEEFQYSSAHLSRLFKEHIGYNFYEYLQDIRLVNVIEQLKKSQDVLLIDCALENGFPNVKSFITTFKRVYHCTPSEWRKNRQGK